MSTKNDDLISGWKDIATYMDKSVRTVQRWAAMRGMPVFHPAGLRCTPHASKRLLNAWITTCVDGSNAALAKTANG
ncbi:MAG: hypothetical protein KJ042_03910 [Deltaproteobacteria bacterium]|nr:hypothetical protein [Deltaproteobacteria bacterium]